MSSTATATPAAKQPPPVLEYDSTGGRIWRVGTLTYTRGGLSNVFLWMLWGDFCLTLMDFGVVPNLVPLQMKKHGASGMMIGFITGTVMELMSTVMVAIVSTWSDRHRGRLGRRMPFLLWATPPLALCLVALGFSPQLAAWLKAHAPGVLVGVSIGSLTIGTMSVALTAYKFFDIFPQSVYYYLWPDVIPARLMGTFTSMFRVVGTLGSILFNWKLIRYVETHPQWICLLAAGLYLFSFLMLVFMVREGEYPPPEPPPQGTFGERAVKTVRRYVRECFSSGYYWKIYLFNLFFVCGLAPFRNFLILYARDTLHIDIDRFGRAMLVKDIVLLAVFLALGPIVDRFHPLRAGIVANVATCVAGACAFAFIRDPASFMVWAIVVYAAVAIFQVSTMSLGPRILPQKQYGQFVSAINVVFRLGIAVVMPFAGWFFDRVGYRYVSAWFAAFTFMSSVMIILLYRDWKRLGGDANYEPPVVEEQPSPLRAFEVVTDKRVAE
jgi:maltose/moltooligosaccharide transporter